jgi:hypothetical protein
LVYQKSQTLTHSAVLGRDGDTDESPQVGITGRVVANGKRRETDLQIAPVRIGYWADETSTIGHF